MGADHGTQTTLTDWKFPRGTQEIGAFIVEQLSSPLLDSYDTPGAWAQMVNNIYEMIKPPLINDTPGYNTTLSAPGWHSQQTGYNSSSVIARYRIPHQQVGTGTDGGATIEGLNLSYYAMVGSAGPTGTIRLSTPDEVTTDTFTNDSTPVWNDRAKTDFDDSLHDEGTSDIVSVLVDPEVTVDLITTSGTASVHALQLYWWAESSTLPDGPYDNHFDPCNVSKYADQSQGLSVQKLRKLIADLEDLKRRRTPGMIISCYLPQEALTVNGGGTTDMPIRAIAWRHELVNNARIYVYARAESTTGSVTVSLKEAGVSGTVVVNTTTYAWYRVDLAFSPRRNLGAPVADELQVKMSSARLRGCCAWFRPITTRM